MAPRISSRCIYLVLPFTAAFFLLTAAISIFGKPKDVHAHSGTNDGHMVHNLHRLNNINYDGISHLTRKANSFAPLSIPSSEDLGPLGALEVHAEDFNGDGFVDILVTGVVSESMILWINDGAGTFTYRGQFLYAGDNAKIAVGDIDRDGDIDIVSSGNDSPFQPDAGFAYLNNGDGFFYQGATDLFTTNDIFRIELADFDGDNALDAYIIFSSFALPDQVFWNDGDGNFSPGISFPNSQPTTDFAIGDIDQDIDLDLIVARDFTDTQVWTNDGTGQFTLTSTLQQSEQLSLGDANGDGRADLVISPSGPFSPEVWLNDGTGQFAFHSVIPVNEGADYELADVNNDEADDLFLINCCHSIHQDHFSLWLNDGSGQFTLADQGNARNIRQHTLADLDSDGDLDYIFGQNAYSGFGILQPIWLFDEPISPLSNITITHDAISYTVDRPVFLDIEVSSGTIISAHWDLGNGNKSELLRPVANYSSPGIYTVGVTLTNSSGSVHAQKTITVTGSSSQTLSVTHPSTAITRVPVSFDVSPGLYSVDFGDGAWALTFGIYTRTYHLYTETGVYTVSMGGPDGLINSSKITITDASLAGLNISVLEPVVVGQPAIFTATTDFGMPITYSWDMGDGTILVGRIVTHTYSAYGMYTITLTATDGMTTLQTSVIVGEPLRKIFLPAMFAVLPEEQLAIN